MNLNDINDESIILNDSLRCEQSNESTEILYDTVTQVIF